MKKEQWANSTGRYPGEAGVLVGKPLGLSVSVCVGKYECIEVVCGPGTYIQTGTGLSKVMCVQTWCMCLGGVRGFLGSAQAADVMSVQVQNCISTRLGGCVAATPS